jgi:hypothetical protein
MPRSRLHAILQNCPLKMISPMHATKSSVRQSRASQWTQALYALATQVLLSDSKAVSFLPTAHARIVHIGIDKESSD